MENIYFNLFNLLTILLIYSTITAKLFYFKSYIKKYLFYSVFYVYIINLFLFL